MLFTTKKIFAYYSNEDSILLPQELLYVKQPLSQVKEKLSHSFIPTEQLLLASIKNYKQLSIVNLKNAQKSLPKDYTFLAFDMKKEHQLHLVCDGKNVTTPLRNISLRYNKKDWTFTTSPLACSSKTTVDLITDEGVFPLKLKSNTAKKAKLIYKSTKKKDAAFYRYLIHIEESIFIHYVPYSKMFPSMDAKLSKEAQVHSKMLHSLFGIIFSRNKQRILMNHSAYNFLIDYKKVLSRLQIQNQDFKGIQTLIDEIGLQLENDKMQISKYLIIANRSAYQDIEYDATLIFSNTPQVNTLFPNAITIKKNDFHSVQHNISTQITSISYVMAFILLILFIALVHSFITRLYKRYKPLFTTLVFYGFDIKVLTLLLTILTILSISIASLIHSLLLQKINSIFNTYYVDLIQINVQTTYLLFIAICAIIYAYIYESKVQKKLFFDTKGDQ